eukprot:1159491-Pelagomonas_calceolata.AAC.10
MAHAVTPLHKGVRLRGTTLKGLVWTEVSAWQESATRTFESVHPTVSSHRHPPSNMSACCWCRGTGAAAPRTLRDCSAATPGPARSITV